MAASEAEGPPASPVVLERAGASSGSPAGPTLLPARVASWISLAAQTSSISMRIGTSVVRGALAGARITSLTGLEWTRGTLEGILSSAGFDVAAGAGTPLGQTEAESILEQSLALLHSGLTHAAFVVATGFHLTSGTVWLASAVSQQLFATLDSVLGSTESSRAIASIVTLIRREFRNPMTGVKGERVGLADLLVGIVGLALLQRWARSITEREMCELGVEEIVWDAVVVLNDGARADVVVAAGEECEEQQLPPHALVRVLTKTTTTTAVRVEVSSTLAPRVASPPGFVAVETNSTRGPELLHENKPATADERQGHIVYQAVKEQEHPRPHQTGDIPGEVLLPDMLRPANGQPLEMGDDNGLVRVGLDRTSSHGLRLAPDVGSRMTSQTQRSSLKSSIGNVKSTGATSAADPKSPAQGSARNQANERRPRDSRGTGEPDKKTRKTSAAGFALTRLMPRDEQAGVNDGGKSVVPRPSTAASHEQGLLAVTGKQPAEENTQATPRHKRRKSHSPSRLDGVARSPETMSPPGRSRSSSRASRHQRGRRRHSVISSVERDADQTKDGDARIGRPSGGPVPTDVKTLVRTGRLAGSFPAGGLIPNLTRFMRFASTAYGSHFLRVMGIASDSRAAPEHATHHSSPPAGHHHHHSEHRSFSLHAGLPTSSPSSSSSSTILLSSFIDPQGGSNASGETGPDTTGLPLVHFVSLDHASRAVVFTCRGTLGFEDVLTDMVCEYDGLRWRGQTYTVHKGIHASARRLLHGPRSRVLLATIRAALVQHPDYGLVLCGHSLGGAVAALLAVMIAVPAPAGSATATAAFVTSASSQLPADRAVHAYAFGPPATVCGALQRATRGLVTSLVHGQDVVPSLSLGTLRDLQAVALAFQSDDNDDDDNDDDNAAGRGTTKARIRAQLWDAFLPSALRRAGAGGVGRRASDAAADDHHAGDAIWAHAALVSLRASMRASKLVPPGAVFHLATTATTARPVLRGDGETRTSAQPDPRLRPATRVRFTHVRDVAARFGEVRLASPSLLADHHPGRYEAALAALSAAVVGGKE
ncbi:MAG: hypothetical protein M1826_004140 [Phylliscum demangeonii]|nr:MAG: hypothetical protein M1826_004140 [Phylliscum demangeonii]